MLSIIIPVYDERDNVKVLHEKILEAVKPMNEPYEIIFVDDGSTDDTVQVLKTLANVKILILAMDYGQTSALDAGIHEAQGDIIVTLDGDLQNDPADIPAVVSKIREGFDVVSGWRVDRNDSSGRRLLSRMANWLTATATGLYLHDSACAMKAYRRDNVQAVHMYGEMHVFLPAYLYRLGAKVAEMPVRHHARQFGISKHYFMKAVKDIFDLVTVMFLVTLQGRPLLFFGTTGVVSIITGFLVGMVSVYLKLVHLRNFGQTPLPILAVFFILSGVLFFMLGLLAELIRRVYYETSHRTPYTIRQRIITP